MLTFIHFDKPANLGIVDMALSLLSHYLLPTETRDAMIEPTVSAELFSVPAAGLPSSSEIIQVETLHQPSPSLYIKWLMCFSNCDVLCVVARRYFGCSRF